MTKQRSFIFTFIFVCLALFIAALCEAKPLKVGVILPLSGSTAAVGKAVKAGIELALSELPNSQLEFVYEDDGYVTSRSVAAFKKLVEFDKVDLVISEGSAPTAAIAPLAEAASIPLIAWASDERVGMNRRFVLRSAMKGYDEGKKAAEEGLKAGYQRVGVIVSQSDFPESVRNGFISNYPSDKIIFTKEYLPDEKDYRSSLARARADKADALYLCVVNGPLSILGKQIRESGFKGAVFGCESLHDFSEIKNSDYALVGAWFVTYYVSEDFRKKYIERLGNDDVISGAAVHYDLVKLLNEITPAIKDRKEIIGAILKSGPHRGASGSYEAVSENGDQYFWQELILKEATREGFRELPRKP